MDAPVTLSMETPPSPIHAVYLQSVRQKGLPVRAVTHTQ